MSPERVARAYSSSSSAKPYSRNVFPGLSPDLSSISSSSFALHPIAVDHGASATQSPPVLQPGGQVPGGVAQPVERPGFPTYAQYKQIETGYIESLTPRRQGKALISQAMFDRIWDVLHHPESQLETAQFRFWARKMFTIERNYRITLGVAEGQESPTQEVLLHDNLLVAIQEQLYDLLCYCHGSTGHGGRDKTCALIRKHYTWVPKDLVSNFIKACPTCIMKKCGGNVDVNSQIPQLMAEADKLSSGAAHARLISVSSRRSHSRIVAQEDETTDLASIPRPRAAAPVETHAADSRAGSNGNLFGFSDTSSSFGRMSASIGSMSTFQDAPNPMVSTSLPWSISGNHQQGLSLAPLMTPIQGSVEQLPPGDDVVPHPGGMHHHHQGSPHLPAAYQFTQPMVREVSLYKGLPNGWQYRHDDFLSAHTEFMETKRQWDSNHLADTMTDDLQGFRGDMSHYNAPRIPDIAGFWSHEQFNRTLVKEEVDEESLLLSSGYHRLHYPIPPPMVRSLDLSDSHLPPGLRNIQHEPQTMGSPQLTENGGSGYFTQIDPALLAMSTDSSSAISITSGSGSERLGPLSSHNEGVDGEVHPVDSSVMDGMISASLPPSSYPILSTSSTATSLSKRVVVPPPLQLDMLAANDKLLGKLMYPDDQVNHRDHGDGTSGAVLDSQIVASNTPDRASSDDSWKTANTSPASTSSMDSTAQLLSPFSSRSDSSTPATTPVDEEGRGSLKVDRNLAGIGGGLVVKKKDEEMEVEELVANMDESGDEGSRLLVAESQVAC